VAVGRNLFGLSAQAKARLIEKLSSAAATRMAPARVVSPAGSDPARLDVADLEAYREIRLIEEAADYLGIDDPFFRVHEGIAGAETLIGNRSYINFASYNYIGLNGDPRIAAAAKAAIDRYGTSVSASRPVSGERPIHRELERALARIHGSEDSVALVGGHSTNVTVIGHLLGRNDVIVHYALKMQPAEILYRHPDANSRITSVFTELLERQFPIESPQQTLQLRTAKDYADRLSIHVNHLNKTLKESTGKTTTTLIAGRIVQEAINNRTIEGASKLRRRLSRIFHREIADMRFLCLLPCASRTTRCSHLAICQSPRVQRCWRIA